VSILTPSITPSDNWARGAERAGAADDAPGESSATSKAAAVSAGYRRVLAKRIDFMGGLFLPEPSERRGQGEMALDDVATARIDPGFVGKPDRMRARAIVE
jgi:hypothetical protein